MRGIAFRRHHKKRVARKADKVLNTFWSGGCNPDRRLHWPAHKWADNLKKCSCPMCSPRKSGEKRPLDMKADAEERFELSRLS